MRAAIPPKQARRRAAQLRLAKQRQRARQREAGLVACQLMVPKPLADRLRELVKRPAQLDRLLKWLALELIDLDEWPQLRELAWGRHGRWIPGAEALALYERNWRFVARDRLTPEEAALIDGLALRHGNGSLNA